MTELFKKCIKVILENEGGYVWDKDDDGGETYRGVARDFHPDWAGWQIIDDYKEEVEIHWNEIINNSNLNNMVIEFYYEKFYEPLHIEGINDENIVLELFDFGVNAGLRRSIKKAQSLFMENPDGVIGPISTKRINEYPGDFLQDFKKVRIEYYKERVRKNPRKAKFLKNWVKRVNECKF